MIRYHNVSLIYITCIIYTQWTLFFYPITQTRLRSKKASRLTTPFARKPFPIYYWFTSISMRCSLYRAAAGLCTYGRSSFACWASGTRTLSRILTATARSFFSRRPRRKRYFSQLCDNTCMCSNYPQCYPPFKVVCAFKHARS